LVLVLVSFSVRLGPQASRALRQGNHYTILSDISLYAHRIMRVNVVVAKIAVGLRVIKRVAPPDDAAALLHVEDVRRTLQQMGLFQTFT